MINTETNKLTRCLLGLAGVVLLGLQGPVQAKEDQKFPYTGDCASLGADRTTEFHGNPERAELLLGMAGNQWTVFDEVMRQFNFYRGLDDAVPAHQDNYSLAELRDPSRADYYIQLIPPGQIRDQIKSGCMTLGNIDENDPGRNFLPLSIQVEFDVFASTNYNLMRDLAASGFVTEALPYTKNQLDLMVREGNPKGIGVGNTDYERIFDMVMDLLDANVAVSQPDHINEGIHRGINNMYKAMDEYIRTNGSDNDIDVLDAALAAVQTPLPGSPGETRPLEEDIDTDFNLATNAECHYSDGTLRFCEIAVLNKINTHETRVHHVETPARVRSGESDTGPLWVTEVAYAEAKQDEPGSTLVRVGGVGIPEAVNTPVTYSITLLSTAKHKRLGREFIDWIRSPLGQQVYEDGGFLPMSDAELAGGECYSVDRKTGELLPPTPRVDNSCK